MLETWCWLKGRFVGLEVSRYVWYTASSFSDALAQMFFHAQNLHDSNEIASPLFYVCNLHVELANSCWYRVDLHDQGKESGETMVNFPNFCHNSGDGVNLFDKRKERIEGAGRLTKTSQIECACHKSGNVSTIGRILLREPMANVLIGRGSQDLQKRRVIASDSGVKMFESESGVVVGKLSHCKVGCEMGLHRNFLAFLYSSSISAAFFS